MAGDITRQSHYVPQATLRRWSLDGIHLSAYRLLVSHPNIPEWQTLTIRGLARQRDLYTTFEGDAEGDDVEKFITREIEEPGQDAIERLLGNSALVQHGIACARCLNNNDAPVQWPTSSKLRARGRGACASGS